MSKAQRYKQQQKQQKEAQKAAKNPTPVQKSDESAKTLRQRQAENKEALRKHQASMTKLKEFEAKLHPQPAGGVAAEPEKERSALQDMFFDGGNLSKDASRTQPVHSVQRKEASPAQPARAVGVSHEKDTTIKA